MSQLDFVSVGQNARERTIAATFRPGRTPGLFWLNGYRSDMMGNKARAVDEFGAQQGLAVTRFDCSGHGQSSGRLEDGTISDWLEEAIAVFARTSGPQIIIGSSLGGWLALLLNKALRAKQDVRVAGLVLIAPAVDTTSELIPARLSAAERQMLAEKGYVERPSKYLEEPDIYTARLLEDGNHHLLLGSGSITTSCPVHIIQGVLDPDVPYTHVLKLVSHLTLDPTRLTMVPDGDHRLSRPQDLQIILSAIGQMVDKTKNQAP